MKPGRRAAVVLSIVTVVSLLPFWPGTAAEAAAANPLAAVPVGHWAYGAVRELVTSGLLQGYPVEGFGDTPARTVTRYEMAVMVMGVVAGLEEQVGWAPGGQAGPVSVRRLIEEFNRIQGQDRRLPPREARLVERLVEEFRGELGALGSPIVLPQLGRAGEAAGPLGGPGELFAARTRSAVTFDGQLEPGARWTQVQGRLSHSLEMTLDWMERKGFADPGSPEGPGGPESLGRLSLRWQNGEAVVGTLPVRETPGARFFGREEALQGLWASMDRGRLGTSLLIADQAGKGQVASIGGSVEVNRRVEITGGVSRSVGTEGVANALGLGTVARFGSVEVDARLLLDLDELLHDSGNGAGGTSIGMNLPELAPGVDVGANYTRRQRERETSLWLGFAPSEDTSVNLGYQLLDFLQGEGAEQVSAALTIRF